MKYFVCTFIHLFICFWFSENSEHFFFGRYANPQLLNFHADEFDGEGAKNYSEHSVTTWSCSDRWAGEGGLMCCNIQDTWNGDFNRSCCPGVGAINLFSIGSKPGTVKLIPLSTSSPPPTRSSRSDAITSSILSLSSSTTLFLTAKPTAASSDELASPISSPAPSHFKSKGSTVAMAVGISVGALVLFIVSYLIYRCLQKRNKRNFKQDRLVEEEEKEVPELEEVHHPKELDGHREHELPSGQQDHELPSSERQINEMPSSELLICGKTLAKSRFLRQELPG